MRHPTGYHVPGLVLFPFRFLDPVSGKWRKARYVAEFSEISQRYEAFEIIGPPEIRRRGGAAHFRMPGASS